MSKIKYGGLDQCGTELKWLNPSNSISIEQLVLKGLTLRNI